MPETGLILGGGYIETLVDLSSYNGQNVQIRFRMATDDSAGDNGDRLDQLIWEVFSQTFINR